MTYKNAPIHPFLRFIYISLRGLARVMVWVFFRRRVLLGAEHLRFDGPAIVIVNHPSTLMDVLAPGIHVHQIMYFLANYGLFKNPVSNWLLTRLFCIPVIRKEDVGEGVERNNEPAFEKSFQHLEKNGVLFIAPEGVSWMNRMVRPFKTGTARIACGAEARNNWDLDVKIIPIGLTYSAPHLFRTDVVVQAGPPVYARDWKEQWETDREATADALTLHLETSIKALCVHTPDEASDHYIKQLEVVAQNDQPLPLRDAFFRARRLAARYLDDAPMRDQTTRYFEMAKKAGLDDTGLSALAARRSGWRTFKDAFWLAAGAPLFVAGYAFWFLPCFLPWLLNKLMKLYIGYSSTVKTLSALFVFPAHFYGVYKLLSNTVFASNTRAGIALLLLTALGWLVEAYARMARQFWSRWKAILAAAARPDQVQELIQLRPVVNAE